MTRELTRQDLLDLARGAAFLGTGGGGDPYIGRLMVERALGEGGTVTLLPLDEVPDDWFVIPRASHSIILLSCEVTSAVSPCSFVIAIGVPGTP